MNKKIINSKDQNGFTALHKACGQGDLEVVKYLLENDAELISEAGGDPSPEANSMSMASD